MLFKLVSLLSNIINHKSIRMKKIFFLLVLVLFTTNTFSQNTFRLWHFNAKDGAEAAIGDLTAEKMGIGNVLDPLFDLPGTKNPFHTTFPLRRVLTSD